MFPVDYRCEDVRFPVPASCVTISNPNSLSSSETGVNPGIRSWKKHLSEWARSQEAIDGIYFTKKWWAKTIQSGLEFDNFEHFFKTVSSNASSGWTVRFFGVDDWCYWKRESRPIYWHQCRLLTRQHFISVFASIVNGVLGWNIKTMERNRSFHLSPTEL